ncbi:restriction system-associated AAA family ATPase [Pseudomonas aeruginosa]|nr:restriction system-associated AAA family ATPase [Pseudomonas aeruginosa]EKV3076559.1 restriction system-associated AAA family ATPase [Pseudomonas aeruginosa]MCS8559930.1 restriction system-associated AAA family ATPase [Pseudomonas aeruginosa]MCT0517595.1 restriction system-associated AAA family ATPase [Pseudomonas aeruginosa]MCT0564085.1 restriction system-associated AAA family ATPase [Pseudomonas aeruginosa]
MKLLRLKITDPAGFRSLPFGFEHHFRTERSLQKELAQPEGFTPFVCAGPNGSGKSNLLEVLAAIFYHLQCMDLESLPDSFRYEKDTNPRGFRGEKAIPDAFELEYLVDAMHAKGLAGEVGGGAWLRVQVVKLLGQAPEWSLRKLGSNEILVKKISGKAVTQLLPEYVLGYSSGENEVLSLPFFKTRFVQFDEYWQRLTQQLDFSGKLESRLIYLDNSFSQAILLCNLLFQNSATLRVFHDEVAIKNLEQFRIIIRRSIALQPAQLAAFDNSSDDQKTERSNRIRAQQSGTANVDLEELALREVVNEHAALWQTDLDEGVGSAYRVNLVHLLEGQERSSIIEKLKRCATLHYHDETSDSLVLDYWVNDATKEAFRANFDNDALALFRALQVLLVLNLYPVSDDLKADIYRSDSHYVSETAPTLASDKRIMRFKNFQFSKQGVSTPLLLKQLSDGEHQLLHSVGLCLLFRNTNSLFLLDEPETHFNPAWRSSFITSLRNCLQANDEEHPEATNNNSRTNQEMLITTHSPFLISDCTPDKVLVFSKKQETGVISINHPEYNTLGASINKITHETFGKRETIGGGAQQVLEQLLADPMSKADPHGLARKIMDTMGDSVERTLAVHALLQTPGADKEPG